MVKTILPVLAVLFAAIACGEDKPAPKPPKRHQGEGRIYEKKISASIVAPKGWEQGKNVSGSYLIFRGPPDERTPNLNVSTFAQNGVPIRTIGQSMSKATAKGIPGWQSADEGAAQVDGKRAYYITGKYERDNGIRKEQMQTLTYYVQGNGRGYVLSFLVNQEKFENLKPTLEEMVKSFRCD